MFLYIFLLIRFLKTKETEVLPSRARDVLLENQ